MFVGLWAWAIWSCAEHWRGNPNYSYGWAVPFLALCFGLRRYCRVRGGKERKEEGRTQFPIMPGIGLAFAFGALVFGLEFARQQIWHPQITLELICLLAAAFSLYKFRTLGQPLLARAEIFPVLFFFTAVPWPARFEQPTTSTLIRWVAKATAELLHWIGVEAQTSGGAIALTNGLVGITEACSGIRSLQAGIMFGLALGEWFLLPWMRRIVLLVIAIALAFLTNLGRTLALALQAEWHGVHSVEEVHDVIGNLAVTSLIVGIWLAGKLLRERRAPGPLIPIGDLMQKMRGFAKRLCAAGEPL